MNIVKLNRVKAEKAGLRSDSVSDIQIIDDLINSKAIIDSRIAALDDLRKAGGVTFVQIQIVGKKARTVKEVLIDIAPDDDSFIDTLIALEEKHLADLDVEALVYEDQADLL